MKRTLAGRAAGDLDVLVSNAGETVRAPLESVPLAEIDW
jgi:NAD(P)-dependent dehydrogenase (short-subunit alcohol dehydrogenase family)